MGGQHQNIIEINGRKYDAVTGALINIAPPENKSNKQATPTQNSSRTNGSVIDGFVKQKRTVALPTSISAKPNNFTGSRDQQAHHIQKKTQKSETLHRKAVKKPETPAPRAAQPVSLINKSHLGNSTQRQTTAAQTSKSAHVAHFNGAMQVRSSVIKKYRPLSVKQPTPIVEHSAALEKIEQRQLTHVSHASSKQTAAKLIEKALASATSHLEPQISLKEHAKGKRLSHKVGISARAMAISCSVLAGVLLAGFFAIQNVPNLSMRVAAARAGVAATMPAYSPSGFAFSGPIDYSAGQVTISFKSRTDDRSYSLTQKTSNWNSDALLSEFVMASNQQYQTYLDRGRTLYIYDGSNATWVDNGIWYHIEGESNMTTDQLVRIAASI